MAAHPDTSETALRAGVAEKSRSALRSGVAEGEKWGGGFPARPRRSPALRAGVAGRGALSAVDGEGRGLRTESLLDDDRRRVARPPGKAAAPAVKADHERRRYSLESAAAASSSGCR
jgi:hypothetical protein